MSRPALTIDNRDAREMMKYYEARIEALKEEIKRLKDEQKSSEKSLTRGPGNEI